ncbi:hypothetical protein E2562_018800 [Oryza meyeriana var. granulata]|uniref:Uncharacterized protein n=1 Tax=Oryza meyeriana var. granulata TaxID=110450 RepID=A0A6G1F9P8_9ORYZ|nr:hypothetical protein E2562_018800 [Oryza meyeriana var. granulata]
MGFTFEDAKRLWALVRRQDAMVDKKRRWLESMIPGPDGRTRLVKRPKFLKDVSTHYAPRAEDAPCRSEEVLRKLCGRTEGSGGTGHYKDNEVVGGKTAVANHLKTLVCSDNISEVCDETSKVAHMLIREISDKWLLMKNGEMDELNRQYLGGGLVSPDSQDAIGFPSTARKNLKGDILVHAVERLLPNLPKSCIDKIKRIMR